MTIEQIENPPEPVAASAVPAEPGSTVPDPEDDPANRLQAARERMSLVRSSSHAQ